jgi:hypothetical protein
MTNVFIVIVSLAALTISYKYLSCAKPQRIIIKIAVYEY